MNYYAVEIKRTSYVTIHVEATSKAHAEALAFEELENDGSYGATNEADWELQDIYEQFATDDTRSYGPQGAAA